MHQQHSAHTNRVGACHVGNGCTARNAPTCGMWPLEAYLKRHAGNCPGMNASCSFTIGRVSRASARRRSHDFSTASKPRSTDAWRAAQSASAM